MRFRVALIIGLGTVWATTSSSAAQAPLEAKTSKADCELPPPLVCPPPPPPGPQTVEQVDNYIGGLDATLGSIASAPLNKGWTASTGAEAAIDAYSDELKTYRDKVAEYRDRMSPDDNRTMDIVSAPKP